MDDKRFTAEQLWVKIGTDVEQMAQKVADAINNAQVGAIIDQSEEPVREVLAELRQTTYPKASACWKKISRLFPLDKVIHN